MTTKINTSQSSIKSSVLSLANSLELSFIYQQVISPAGSALVNSWSWQFHFPPEWNLLMMTHHCINEGWNQSRLFSEWIVHFIITLTYMYAQQSAGKTCRHIRNNKSSWGLSCWSSRKRQKNKEEMPLLILSPILSKVGSLGSVKSCNFSYE